MTASAPGNANAAFRSAAAALGINTNGLSDDGAMQLALSYLLGEVLANSGASAPGNANAGFRSAANALGLPVNGLSDDGACQVALAYLLGGTITAPRDASSPGNANAGFRSAAVAAGLDISGLSDDGAAQIAAAFLLTPSNPTKLGITTQPSGAASFVPFSVQPVVAIQTLSGSTVTSSTAAVTAAIASGVGTLLGTVTVNAIAGVATFTDLYITGDDTYTITFTSSGLTPATSSSLGPGTYPKYTAAGGQTLLFQGDSSIADYNSLTASGALGGTQPRWCPAPAPASWTGGAVNATTNRIDLGIGGAGKSIVVHYPNQVGQPGPESTIIGIGNVAVNKRRFVKVWQRIVPIELDHYSNTHNNVKWAKFFQDNCGSVSGMPQYNTQQPIATGGLGGTVPQPNPSSPTLWQYLPLNFTDGDVSGNAYLRSNIAFSDLIINGDGTVKSTTINFGSSSPSRVGYGLHIDSGTGFNTGRYYIKSVDGSGNATLSTTRGGSAATVGTPGSTGGTGGWSGLWIDASDNAKIEMAGYWATSLQQTGQFGFPNYEPNYAGGQLIINAGASGFTAGTYTIMSIDPTTHVATLDRACGTVGSNGGGGNMNTRPYGNGFDQGQQFITSGLQNFGTLMNTSGAGGARDGNYSVGWVEFLYVFEPDSVQRAADGYAAMYIQGVKVMSVDAASVGQTLQGAYKQCCDQILVNNQPYGGYTNASNSNTFFFLGGDQSVDSIPAWEVWLDIDSTTVWTEAAS